MIDIKFIERIAELKKRFTGEDVDDLAKKQIAEWERQLQELSVKSDFVALPMVQEIIKLLKARLKTILIERATKGQTPTLEAREKELRYIMELFSPKFQSELDTLDKIIEAELL